VWAVLDGPRRGGGHPRSGQRARDHLPLSRSARRTSPAWRCRTSRKPGVTLGNGCLLVAAAGVTAISSEAVLALLGSVLAAALLVTCRPMIAEVRREFTA